MNKETYKALSWVACKCTLGTKFSSLEFFAASIASFQRLAHRHHFFPPVKPIPRRLLPRDAEKSRKLSVTVALGCISCIYWWKGGRRKEMETYRQPNGFQYPLDRHHTVHFCKIQFLSRIDREACWILFFFYHLRLVPASSKWWFEAISAYHWVIYEPFQSYLIVLHSPSWL